MANEGNSPATANGHTTGPASAPASEPGVMKARTRQRAGATSQTAVTNNDDDSDFDWDDPAYRLKSLPVPFDPTLLPGGSRSLSGIAMQSFCLGLVLSGSMIIGIWLASRFHPLWRLPVFLTCLCLFHFLEFWITARYNLRSCKASSFLLFNNGTAYNIAHTAAMLEITITSLFAPQLQQKPVTSSVTIVSGLFLVTAGQAVRSIAMAQAGTNFNHTPQRVKKDDHILVTSGMYSLLRHPSYFGFFWWAVGTQLLVGNKVCLVGYVIVLWRFFSARIRAEEKLLVEFFGSDYEQFRRRTQTGIPFIK